MSEAIVVVGFARTAMGGMQGAFSDVSAPELGGSAIAGAIQNAGMQADQVDEVLMGCVLSAGLGQAPARQASLAAGVARKTPTTTLNKVCGSGLKTVIMAHNALQSGYVNVIVAGGMENMTRAPYMLDRARGGYRLGHGEIYDHMFLDGLQDAYSNDLMGNYAEATAEKYGFTREAQDAFAIESLTRASKAIAEGKFEREITPVTVKTRRGETIITVDEQPGNARPDKIPSLRPAFKKDGTVTAANSSSISDGAAALVLMRESDALAKKLQPIARIVGCSEHAQDPEWFTTAPVGAVKKLLEKNNWSVADIDLFEVNEAFAVVTMAAMEELGLDSRKVNVHGGACALGHPLGASGARVLVTLLGALQTYGKKRGVATLCIGGGEGIAVGVEMI
ncbi:acetyl-CoA C-acyltransferase [Teredinibacter franksiae]|uniref:acetyl-CoA C-acyltransferase n=1 Tax=Teredinibacter franksiae TaxID=2761453 RepID=UPI001629570C|nr:acetyl-CoA C-acyltransferase [Teredinibacter franksiae]